MSFEWPEFHAWYVLSVGLALLVSALFPVTKHLRDAHSRRQYYLLQGITFVCALVGAKLVFVVAELNWPWEPWPGWRLVLSSGRSIVGALIFGLLGAECAKPLVRYPLPPNDRFAAVLPFSLAIGRFGCFMNGCCRGLPCEGPLAVRYDDGMARHPAALYEMAFQLLAGLGAVLLVRGNRLRGQVFSVYLIAYGSFRYLVEFVRETPKTFGAWSAYQWLSLAMIVLGGLFFIGRRANSSTRQSS